VSIEPTDQLDRIEQHLAGLRNNVDGLRKDVDGLHADFNGYRTEFATYRQENAAVLGCILATLEGLQRRPITFRWPWERAQ
jgi:hypothetical protein